MQEEHLSPLIGKYVQLLMDGCTITGILVPPECEDTDEPMWAAVEDSVDTHMEDTFQRRIIYFEPSQVSGYEPEHIVLMGDIKYKTTSMYANNMEAMRSLVQTMRDKKSDGSSDE